MNWTCWLQARFRPPSDMWHDYGLNRKSSSNLLRVVLVQKYHRLFFSQSVGVADLLAGVLEKPRALRNVPAREPSKSVNGRLPELHPFVDRSRFPRRRSTSPCSRLLGLRLLRDCCALRCRFSLGRRHAAFATSNLRFGKPSRADNQNAGMSMCRHPRVRPTTPPHYLVPFVLPASSGD